MQFNLMLFFRIPPEDVPVRVTKPVVRIQVTQTSIRPIVQITEGLPHPGCTTSPYMFEAQAPLRALP